jgi:hemoglobin-like flavoprotein
MPMDPEPMDDAPMDDAPMDIHESLDRILESEASFGSIFYEVFFERHPEAAVHFDGIDMHRQALLLTMALTVIERYYSRAFPAVEQYLQLLGSRHSDRSIPRDLYPKWSQSMLIALERFHDGDWNDHVAQQWRDALEQAAQLMFRGYERRMGI